MTKFLKIAVIVLALSTLATGVLAEVWGPFLPDNYSGSSNATLQIARQFVGSDYQWTYTLYNGTPSFLIESFSVGVLVDDTNGMGLGSTTSGHFYGESASVSGYVFEMQQQILWGGFSMQAGQTATFTFMTDLTDVGLANHQARDASYTPDWVQRQTPAPAPEPTSLLALLTGIGSAGFIIKRRA